LSKFDPKKHSTLWQISHSDYAFVSYLLGTIHIGHPEVFNRWDQIKEIITDCEAIALEHHLDQAKESPLSELFMTQHLDELLGEKKFKKIRRIFLKSLTVDINSFKHMYPMQLMNLLMMTALNTKMAAPMDLQIWQFAKAQDKTLIGLESLETTQDIFNQISIPFQLKQLKEAARNIKSFRRSTDKILRYYKEERIDKIYKLTQKGMGELRSVLIYDRNIKMAFTTAKMLKEQSTFIAIGAAHLYGAKGMLRLLKEHGFILKALNPKVRSV